MQFACWQALCNTSCLHSRGFCEAQLPSLYKTSHHRIQQAGSFLYSPEHPMYIVYIEWMGTGVYILYTVPDAISVYLRGGASGLTNSAKWLFLLPFAVGELKVVYLYEHDWIAVHLSKLVFFSPDQYYVATCRNTRNCFQKLPVFHDTFLFFLSVFNSNWYKLKSVWYCNIHAFLCHCFTLSILSVYEKWIPCMKGTTCPNELCHVHGGIHSTAFILPLHGEMPLL